jgi:lipid-A-disaccharide synthase
MPRRILITAADVSGDQHAAELIRCLRRLDPGIEVEALGGTKMARAGAGLMEDTVSDAAMGWQGALRFLTALRWWNLMRLRHRAGGVDLHICVDSSAINIPLAKLARKAGVPVLYYIPPQLWASRPWRIRKIRAYVDRVACIFPFEEEYYRSRRVNATFVGHPLFDEMPTRDPRPIGRGPRFPDAPPVIGIVPGSRKSEVWANLPRLVEVMDGIKGEHPGAKFLVPTTAGSQDPIVEILRGRSDVTIKRDAFDEFVPQCDLVITKSGTSTVQVAAHGVPMIVVYRINPIVWHLAARWLIRTRKIAMVNILAGNIDLVPEFIPWYGSTWKVTRCALDVLKNPKKLREQREALRKLIATLGGPGASMKAAKIAMEMMNNDT